MAIVLSQGHTNARGRCSLAHMSCVDTRACTRARTHARTHARTQELAILGEEYIAGDRMDRAAYGVAGRILGAVGFAPAHIDCAKVVPKHTADRFGATWLLMHTGLACVLE